MFLNCSFSNMNELAKIVKNIQKLLPSQTKTKAKQKEETWEKW